jgi:hypothetical protein
MTAGSVFLLLLSGKGAPGSPFPGARIVVRRAGAPSRVCGRVWLSAPLPAIVPSSTAGTLLKPVTRAVLKRRGRVSVGQLPPAVAPSVYAGMLLKPLTRAVLKRRGRVSVGQLPPAVAPSVYAGALLKPITRAVSRRRGRVSVGQLLTPRPSLILFPSLRIARRPDERTRRIAVLCRGTRWIPALPSAPSVIVYRVYSNTGAGDSIRYGSPIAIVATLGYVTSALNYPGAWSFGVRAFDVGSGLEEQNVDAAVTIVLDANGNDITNQPSPPTGLRAFALAGGSVRVEWTYPAANRAKLPTGFHVYIGTGGTISLVAGPVATVPFTSAIAGSFVANLTGLTDGTAYTIVVRAYNATAEETNTNSVNVTADATGPATVDSLTATATV